MASLDRTLRKDLETTVKKARRVAEAGARKAVAQLGVGEAEAPRHLSAEQRALRNRLRAHGRQLGDRRDPKTAVQASARLIQECAYEHWHRMLFARFLAETDLLIEPESAVAITLEEVQELAREKATDWLPLASDYAERMLPQIFRKDNPVLQIALPPETRSEMEDLLKALSKPVFEADDSLGWVYQFWQADKKDEVNKSEVKIGADELPAVTQLFTEDYMVLFLLHNTLGAWWAGKVLAGNPVLARSAKSEDDLRAACKVGDVDWTYLRFMRDKAEDGSEGPWRPAAGNFEGWPTAARKITLLDPCMGSGHFLVFALPILIAFRMSEESLSQWAAVDAVLNDNLFGLEIDPRCTQIAAFNLAFAIWRKVGYRPLPQLNLACSGLAIGVTKAEWQRLAEKTVTAVDPAAKRDLLGVETNLLTVGLEERVKNGLGALYDLFTKAPWLGSLINPRRADADIFREGFDRLEPLLTSVLATTDTDDTREMAVAAQGVAKAAELLGRSFVLVTTNVPYLGRGKQDNILREYAQLHFDDAKSDLSTCFIRRCIEFCEVGGSASIVSPRNWWFLSGYKGFRQHILDKYRINLAATLGEEAWETYGDRGPNTVLMCCSRRAPSSLDLIAHVAAHSVKARSDKRAELRLGHLGTTTQFGQRANAAHVITLSNESKVTTLGDYGRAWQGLVTGDDARFVAKFWEVHPIDQSIWSFFQGPPKRARALTGRECLIRFEHGNGPLHLDSNAHNFPPKSVLGQEGVAIQQMRYLNVTRYTGEIFSPTVAPFIPNDPDNLPAILAYMLSDEFKSDVRKYNTKVNVTNGTFSLLPFDLDHWKAHVSERYVLDWEHGYKEESDNWVFEGSPNDALEPLQVAVARLLGYLWPRQSGIAFKRSPPIMCRVDTEYGDSDGIVCLTALKGQLPAEQQLVAWLAKAFGADWSAAKLVNLLTKAGFAGQPLTDWLRDGFFTQHCELFHQRPFVWHIWDGRQDGFHALVNYHRLAAPNGEGRRTLEKLIYSYLGDWIDRQRADQKAGIEGADARLAHVEHLKAELIKILEGEPPYDVFVRWKPLHEQPIGWDPDMNDGVRMNMRPFMSARPLNARGANACILRATPKIKWDKDRGKEPTRDKADYPWFWGWDESTADFAGGAEFDGNRWNDLHYSRATKQSARDRHRASVGGKT